MPSSSRSLMLRGSYTPSSSTMTLPTRAQNSSSVCQSRPLRARREASMETTAPTLPAADRRQQPLEARPCDAAGGHAEVVVDDHDFCPAERARPIGQGVLASAALVVVAQLVGRRLPHVHVGAARQMLSADLAHRHPPGRLIASAPCRPATAAGSADRRARRDAVADSSASPARRALSNRSVCSGRRPQLSCLHRHLRVAGQWSMKIGRRRVRAAARAANAAASRGGECIGTSPPTAASSTAAHARVVPSGCRMIRKSSVTVPAIGRAPRPHDPPAGGRDS